MIKIICSGPSQMMHDPLLTAFRGLRVISDVLEHLDAVEALGGQHQLVDVAGQNPEIAQAPTSRLGHDVLSLRVGIRYSQNATGGKALGQKKAQRPPTAAQVEHLLTVSELGSFHVKLEHGLLCLVESIHSWVCPPSQVPASILDAVLHRKSVSANDTCYTTAHHGDPLPSFLHAHGFHPRANRCCISCVQILCDLL